MKCGLPLQGFKGPFMATLGKALLGHGSLRGSPTAGGPGEGPGECPGSLEGLRGLLPWLFQGSFHTKLFLS